MLRLLTHRQNKILGYLVTGIYSIVKTINQTIYLKLTTINLQCAIVTYKNLAEKTCFYSKEDKCLNIIRLLWLLSSRHKICYIV